MVDTAPLPPQHEQAATIVARGVEAGPYTTPNLAEALQRWLAAELLADHYARLDGARFASDARIPLSEVYVDLPAQRRPPRPYDARTEPEALEPILAAIHRLDAEGARLHERTTMPGAEPAERAVQLRHAMVVGGPGQGKSTVAQQLAQVHRAELLAQSATVFSDRQRKALDLVARGAERDGLRPRRVRLPVRIALPAYMGWIERAEDADLPRALAGYVVARARHHGVTVHTDDVVRWMRAVPWLLVLDGLDEVPDQDDRATLREAIDALHAALEGSDGVTVLLSRPQGVDVGAEETWTFELQPLPTDTALDYALRIAAVWFADDPDAQDRLAERLRRAAADEGTARLMRSPLQATILTALLHRVPRAPRERWRLFRTYFDTIYDREMDRAIPSASVLAERRTVIESIHWQIGLFLQMRAEAKGGAEPTLSTDELRAVIQARVAQEGYTSATLAAITDAIEVVARQRLVLLVETRPGRFGFELRSFQEFAAAEALMEGHGAPIAERLKAIAPSHAWRNVLLFAMSRVLTAHADLHDAACVGVCRWLNGANELDAVRWAGSHLAARVLDEEMAAASPRTTLALLGVVLEALGSRYEGEATMIVAAVRKVGADAAVAEACDAAVREAVERWLSKGPREAPVAWDVALRLKTPWARQAVLARWPTEHRELHALRYMRSEWFAELAWGDASALWWNEVNFETMRLQVAGSPGGWDQRVVPLQSAACQRREQRFNAARPGTLFWVDLPLREEVVERPEFRTAIEETRFASLHAFVRSPSRVTLADALQSLTREGTAQWRFVVEALPWQIGACLAALDAGEDAEELLARIRSGALGDAGDWQTARERWESGILRDEEFGELSDEQWPFGPSIATSGLPPVPVNYLGHPSQIAPLAKLLWARAGDARPWVARLCAWRLHALVRHARRDELHDVLPVRELLDFFARHHLTLWFDAIPGIWSTSQPDDMAARLREVEGCASIVDYHRGDTARGTLLVKAWSRAPNLRRIPRLLARSRVIFDPPPAALLADQPEADARTRAALYVLRCEFREQNLSSGSPWEVLRDVAAENPEVFVFLDRLSVTRRNEPVVRAFLTQVRPYLSYAESRSREQSLVGWYYLSTLLDEATVRSLGLPLPPWAPTLQDALTPLADEPVCSLSRIAVDNLRAFTHVKLIPPTSDTTAAPWVILLGENGVGKTTLLRALAFALADPDVASGALSKSAARYRRVATAPASVAVTLGGQTWRTRLVGDEVERLEHEGPDDRPFLVAYGCRRGSAFGGPDRAVNVEPAWNIATLFEETAEGLVHAESWLKELDRRALRDPDGEGARTRDAVLSVLCGDGQRPGLLPGVREIRFDGDQLVVVGDAVGEAPLSALSDGYLTMMGWTIDLMARWVHRQRRRSLSVGRRFTEVMTGVVLIDEIDMHLHPRWQYDVIQTVRQHFPRLTFVATTHNPMTILRARPGELFVLRRERDGQVSARQLDVPKGVRADELLTGPWFGLVSTTDPDTLKLFEDHQRLLREGRPHDDPAVAHLAASLRQRLGRFGDTSIERMVLAVLAELRASTDAPPSPEEREVLKRRALETLRKKREAQGGGAA